MASKTTTVNINESVFHMSESAYQAFSDYIKSVKNYFAHHEGKEEIIVDLESRMAEHFLEKLSPGKQVILKKDIEALIEVMGRVEDFAAEEDGLEAEETTKVRKRFYRDPDHRIIAGVCAGLANYFQIDVRIIRLLFFVSIFFGGLGILAYILLWILVPEAQTAAEKEEMAGYRFDLAAIAKDVEEKVKDIKVPEGFLQKIGQFFKWLGQWVTTLIKFILKVLLFFLRLLSVFAAPILILIMAAFTLIIFALAFDLYESFIYLPLESLENRTSFYFFLFGVYAAVLAPLMALFFAFFSPLKKKWLLTVNKGVVLMSLFLVGGMVAGLGAIDLVPRVQKVVEEGLVSESKKAQMFNDLPTFQSIDLGHPVRQATVVPGENYAVEMLADERCQGVFEPELLGETLSIDRQKITPYNFLCEVWGVDVVITVPDLESVSAWDSSRVVVKDFDFDQFGVSLFGHNQFHLEGGSSQNLNAYLSKGSQLHAASFQVKEAHVDAFDYSLAEVWVTDSLYARAHDSSSIRYKGDPKTSFSEEVESGVIGFESFGDVQKIDAVPPPAVEGAPSTTVDTDGNVNENAVLFTFSTENFNFIINGQENPDLKVKLGQTVTVIPDPTLPYDESHGWKVDGFSGGYEVSRGIARPTTFVADKRGEFEYYCPEGNHREMGMRGKFIVE